VVKSEMRSGAYLHGDAFGKFEGDRVWLVAFRAMLVPVKTTFDKNLEVNVLPECLGIVIPQTVKAESVFPRRYRPARLIANVRIRRPRKILTRSYNEMSLDAECLKAAYRQPLAIPLISKSSPRVMDFS
jgi:hypothetical protein